MPPVYWAIELLTIDTLIDGWIDGSLPFQRAIFNPMMWRDVLSIRLQSVLIQPTGDLQITESKLPAMTVPLKYQLVGVIPKDKNGLDAVQKNCVVSVSAPVQLLVGPYSIQGLLQSTYPLKDIDDCASAGYNYLKDVEINQITPGSRLKGLKAPAMLVSTALLQYMALVQKPQ
ncbi:MAG TPA: hypothetical protein VF326_05465 [Anaerolineaceae bacterium]|jgi:hypothetical protein